MYPLSILTLLIAARGDNRAARYLIPLPVVGAGTSIYHILIENNVISEPSLPRHRPRRLRHELDQRVRLPDDPDARPHGLPPSHRILGPRVRRGSRGSRYPSRACRAVRERDSRGSRPRRRADAAARALEGRRRGPRAPGVAPRARDRRRRRPRRGDRDRARRRPQRRRSSGGGRSSRRATSAACRATGSATLAGRAARCAGGEQPLQGNPAERD